MFSIFLIVWILVAALFVQQQLAVKIARDYELEEKYMYVFGLIPIFGLLRYKNKVQDNNPYEILTFDVIFRSIVRNVVLTFFPLITIYFYIQAIDASTYVPIAIAIYLTLAMMFTQQSIAASIAEKKGMGEIKAGLLGLVPIYGMYRIMKLEPERKLSRTAIPMILKTKNIVGTMIIYLEMIALSAIVIVPIIYVIGTSLNPNSGILNRIWPLNPSFESFRQLFTEKTTVNDKEYILFPLWYMNTLKVALMTMVGAVLFVTGTAYVFARYNFKGKKAGLLTILVLQMFPSFLSLIAIFTLFTRFGLTNNPNALVIIYVSGGIPFNIWLIKGYLQNIPKELDESAKIDGANKLQIFFQIILPLSVPIISFVAVTSFMAPWMDYILPSFLIIDQDKWTLAVGIFDWINNPNNIDYPAFAAAALIVAVPITILYVVFQRYLIEGITAGANKG